MNNDFNEIAEILDKLRLDYVSAYKLDIIDQNAPITERDIVAEIYCRLKVFCEGKGLNVHCEIKPAPDKEIGKVKSKHLRCLPKIDVGILRNIDGIPWISSAIKLQDKYPKGQIEARFSSIPLRYFHTAIEVKIQSNVKDAKKDIDILKKLHKKNEGCNCFCVLLNARGQRADHATIHKYAGKKGIHIIEYTKEEPVEAE